MKPDGPGCEVRLMGIMQRITGLFTKAQTTRDKVVESSVRLMEGSGSKGEKPWPFDYRLAMTQVQSWVYRCGMGNAQAAAAVNLRLYVRAARDRRTKTAHDPITGKRLTFATRPIERERKKYLLGHSSLATRTKLMSFGDDFEEVVESHPVTDLLRKSNPWMNGYEMAVYRFAALEFTGNAYLHPVMGPMDNPIELYPLPPQWVHLVPGRDVGEMVSAYVYGQTYREEQVYPSDEVLHFKYPNPRDLMYGMGKVEAAWTALGLHVSERTMHKALFDNHARPDMLLIAKSGTTPEQIDRLEAKVNGKHKGVRNAGQFLTVTGDIDAKPMSWSPKDVGTDEHIIEEIAGVFGYPITKLKANDPNRANAETGDAGWAKDTILPMLRMDEEALNQSYLPLFQDGALVEDAVLAYDDPVPANRKQELAESKTLVAAGIRTINEDRSLRGDEPLPEGDVLRVNGTALATLDNPQQPTDPLAGIFGALSTQPAAVDPVQIAQDAAMKAVEYVMKDNRRMMRKMLAMVDKKLQQKEPTNGNGDTRRHAATTAAISDTKAAERDNGGRPDAAHDGDGDATKRAGSGGACDTGDQGFSACDSDVQEAGHDAHCGPVLSHKDIACGLISCNHQGIDHKASEDSAVMPVTFKGWRTKADADNAIREAEKESPITRMARALRQVFADMQKDVVALIESTAPGKAKPKNLQAHKKDLTPDDYRELERKLMGYNEQIREAIRPALEQVFDTGGMAGITRLLEIAGRELPGVSFDLSNPAVAQKLQAYAERLAGGVTQTTVARLRASLADGVGKGESVAQLTQRVDQTGLFSDHRAEAIARSESARAYVDGQLESWKQSGVVRGKQWLLAAQACPFCEAAAKEFNNKTVGLDEPFFRQGATLKGTDGKVMQIDYSDVMGPPLHPQCRCDVTATLAEIE